MYQLIEKSRITGKEDIRANYEDYNKAANNLIELHRINVGLGLTHYHDTFLRGDETGLLITLQDIKKSLL